jgi:hypothetical protein
MSKFKSYILDCWKCEKRVRYENMAQAQMHIERCEGKKEEKNEK